MVSNVEGKDLLQYFEGKKVSDIAFDSEYKCYDVTILFDDGSKLTIESEGSEGSHLSVTADINIKQKF